MHSIPEIDIHDANRFLADGTAAFLDIRDPESHAAGHIPGCTHIETQEDLDRFLAATAKDCTVVVYCYHGNSSRGATRYLLEQGFDNAVSMAGGFEAWRLSYDCAPSP
jgi:thiosulfate sulfurtransferase